MAGETGRIYS